MLKYCHIMLYNCLKG